MALAAVTPDRLNIDSLTNELTQGTVGDGAVATFAGLVRNHNQGRTVRFLEYEAYEPLAVRALVRIIDEARDIWPDARLAVHHRIGRLEIGEASVAIVAASPHRGNAFAACRYAIERVKQIRTDLEARALRRRRCLAGGRDRRP